MSKKRINLAIILEVVWFITFILCLGAAIHQTINEGFGKSILLYIITIIALAMFLMRRHLRKSAK
jgi:uncharacterized membrane protein YfcA